ncbi:hypothetical protein [Salinimicrobium sp. TH3]|uniref:hypothetical protein n=1 Tax=Salinimicrobium sp. TH3 TaxID=2997342 RepID=UPI0022755913|nr:hypothetical protein [Salinimicrobium sp. TH3]MCY2687622.1 hypothetical protein [Salinimicrobium sp. TH3]
MNHKQKTIFCDPVLFVLSYEFLYTFKCNGLGAIDVIPIFIPFRLLIPLAGDVFRSNRFGVVEFLRNDRKEISELRLNDVGRLRNISFTKIE